MQTILHIYHYFIGRQLRFISRTGEAEIPSCTWAEVASVGGGMRESSPVFGGERGGNQRSIPIIYAA